ncbi:MAG: YhjD/YihY/BrkB family envelope integrity protein, partial [Desulfovibrionales bacterium]
LRASALTYVTALSIVPLLAVAFSISKGFGFQNTQYIREFLLKVTAGREMVVERIVDYINRTDVGTLGAVGVAGLFLAVISLLSSIEKSFNTIWGVQQSRSGGRKFADYLSITLICPLLIIISISSTASLQSSAVVQTILGYSVFSYAYLVFLKVLPFLLVWTALTFIYKLAPNTTVTFGSALGGAFVAGLCWTVTERMFITYQVGVAKYNAIYGSFAQVPLFLLWLYISWVIVLIGAEISYGLQNREVSAPGLALDEYEFELKEKLAVVVMALLAKSFQEGRGPLSSGRIAEAVNMPAKLVNHVCHTLSSIDLVVLSCDKDREGYLLTRPPESITVVDVLRSYATYRKKEIGGNLTGSGDFVHDTFDTLFEAARQSKANLSLAELASRGISLEASPQG